MKKSLIITTVVVLAVLALCFVACEPNIPIPDREPNELKNPVQVEENCVMIPHESEIMPNIEGKKLKDYFDVLVEKDFLTYEMKGTTLVKINNRAVDESANECWKIYSNDPANTDSTKGTYEHKGVTYNLCTLGLNDIPLTEDTTYLAICIVDGEPAKLSPVQMKDTCVIITLDSEIMPDIDGKKLKDYFEILVKNGYMTYEMDGTMLVKINDRYADGKANEYWMMYSNDPANTNTTWGTFEHEGVTYGSCTLGLNDLPLTKDTTYVFAISKF